MFKDTQNGQTLEELMEEIGKDMCHLKFLYPNAGKWTIQDMWGWEYKGETLIDVFKEFQQERLRNK